MNPTLTISKHQSTNIQQAFNGKWIECNYIWAKSGQVIHYDSWAAYNLDMFNKIRDWCDINIQSDWAYRAGKFYFEDEQDAVLFSLVWMYSGR